VLGIRMLGSARPLSSTSKSRTSPLVRNEQPLKRYGSSAERMADELGGPGPIITASPQGTQRLQSQCQA
jgi:hypothetical protein